MKEVVFNKSCIFVKSIIETIASYESKMISEQTKAALRIKREKCGEWRKSNFNADSRKKAIATIKAKAANNSNNKIAKPLILKLHNQGNSLRQIAKVLNDNDYKTSRGNLFRAQSVSNLLKKAKSDLLRQRK